MMLHYVAVFLVWSVIAGVFAFGGVLEDGSQQVAMLLFFVSLTAAIIFFLLGLCVEKEGKL